MTTAIGYWYLHSNGSRIFKPAGVVDFTGPAAYFDSPFCTRWWRGPKDDSRAPEEIFPGAPVCQPCGLACRLTDGKEIYPSRPDLHDRKIWKCDRCFAYVGCHPGTERSLGQPAGQALRTARSILHERQIERLWKRADQQACYKPEDDKARELIRHVARARVYAFLADRLGIPVAECHTGEFDIDRCRAAWRALDGVTYAEIRNWWKTTHPAKEKAA